MCEAHDHTDLGINPATCGGEAELNLFSDLSESIRKRIIGYVQLKCKEQRMLCLENLEYDKESRYDVDENSILNAPEPIINLALDT